MKQENRGGSDPRGFDTIVREVFAPIYPVIAQQIIQKTGMRSGKCLDVGCGTGALGRSIAKHSDLHVTYFDQSVEMMQLSMDYAKEENLILRSDFLVGDIHDLKLQENSIDLVISRGSSPFWVDWSRAYSEILCVLKTGGKAYIGGGFGNAKLREHIVATMNKNNPSWRNSFKDKVLLEREALPSIMHKLQPSHFSIIDDESGYWVYIIK